MYRGSLTPSNVFFPCPKTGGEGRGNQKMVCNTYVIETGQLDWVTQFKDIRFPCFYPIPSPTPRKQVKLIRVINQMRPDSRLEPPLTSPEALYYSPWKWAKCL